MHKNNSNQTVDLASCEREPIHKLGRVQRHGALLVVSADWLVMGYSENLAELLMLGQLPEIGSPLNATLNDSCITRLREALTDIYERDQVVRILHERVTSAEHSYDIAIHYSGSAIIIEFEVSPLINGKEIISRVRNLLKFGGRKTLSELWQTGVENLANLTGFDRVMLYQFHPDDTGEVVAEVVKDGVDSFIGLRYPSTDIPRQARVLYLRNLVRQITDATDEGVSLVPADLDLDLSMSGIRAVSTIHLEYLRNMGVAASFSVSVVVDNKLWGLLACHHQQPKVLNLQERMLAEILGEAFSQELSMTLINQQDHDLTDVRQVHMHLMATLDNSKSLFENVSAHAKKLRQLIDCDSCIVCIGNEFTVTGEAVSSEDVTILRKAINRVIQTEVLAIDNLREWFTEDITLADRFAGFVAIPISRQPRDLIIYLRKEIVKTVAWAGNPEKTVELGPNGSRLTPRKSFAAWRETSRDTCAAWLERDLRVARGIKHGLLEVIVRNLDMQTSIIKESNRQQDLLIHELNHRARNMLGLINSFVRHSDNNNISVAEFKQLLSSRLQALAMSQKLLTDNNWLFTPLRLLVENEINALVNDKSRVSLSGPPCAVSPKAFTALTLVIHELLTNAVKHGALSNLTGLVQLSWQVSETGQLDITWQETGVLVDVNGPHRRGFGSIIIERSIPHDLGGSSYSEITPSGLVGHFSLPRTHVQSAVSPSDHANMASVDEAKPTLHSNKSVDNSVTTPAIKRHGLVLEDNMLIALSNANMLKAAGFSNVEVAANVAEALKLIERKDIAFALLDINLVNETCEAVADKLTELTIPFAFLTGYSVLSERFLRKYPSAVTIEKPTSQRDIDFAVARLYVT